MIPEGSNWPAPLRREVDSRRAKGMTFQAIADRIAIQVSCLFDWYHRGKFPSTEKTRNSVLRLGVAPHELPPVKIIREATEEMQTPPDRPVNPLPDGAAEKAKLYDKRVFRLRFRLGLPDDLACLIATEMDEHPADWAHRVLRYAEADEDGAMDALRTAIGSAR
ncbi:MAG TPA: hypothetical protein VMY37_16285 [Thermoguttaceae bacterium]|nr:hypothetical protein [Thermoguttaceae bacterium]